ncbi:glycosyl hydrolase [Kocuria rosea]|uniref:glycosyl hydrolase n=1 Tax=Kocuria rosea TaxID=1275 RepID=UPI0025413CDE|nr:glycosyl hydrolase [Kocuria rosea]WIG16356.1 CIA30 family protein [Kocuria rosea]
MSRNHPTRRAFLIGTAATSVFAATACAKFSTHQNYSVALVDDAATAETRSLFAFLKGLQGNGVLFGHQNDTSYGFTFDTPDGEKSDTRAAVGRHPGLFGWDTLILEGKETPGRVEAAQSENEAALIRMLQDGHRLGGVTTVSSHMPNFVNGTDFYDTSGNVVTSILPGGDQHARFRAFLDGFSRVCRGAVADDGSLIPIIFRPWHENNGDWFWWGAGHTSPREYIEIFRFTVEYLRDACSVHNLLYAYSPAGLQSGEPDEYMRTYPGDEFVDVLGCDRYDESSGDSEFFSSVVTDLRTVVELANERGKVPAYTEFGSHAKESPALTWFTDLLAAITADPVARRITYMQTWANFGGSDYAYVPFPAHKGREAHALLPDFQRYAEDPYTMFAGDVAGVFSTGVDAVRNGPLMHLVTPTDRQRVVSTSTVVRARVTGTARARVSFSIDGGQEVHMKRDNEGFWSATWNVPTDWLDLRRVTLTVTAWLNGRRYTDSAVVLLGDAAPLDHGWVDDYEGYAGHDWAVSEAYFHYYSSTTALSSAHKATGDYGLAMRYDTGSTGYTGIGKAVGQDWSAYTALRLWVQGDGSSNGATLQLVADGAHFEYPLNLDNTSGTTVVAPFSAFEPAPWDTVHQGQSLDVDRLRNIIRFNMYIGYGGEQRTGTVYLDDIRAQ